MRQAPSPNRIPFSGKVPSRWPLLSCRPERYGFALLFSTLILSSTRSKFTGVPDQELTRISQAVRASHSAPLPLKKSFSGIFTSCQEPSRALAAYLPSAASALLFLSRLQPNARLMPPAFGALSLAGAVTFTEQASSS